MSKETENLDTKAGHDNQNSSAPELLQEYISSLATQHIRAKVQANKKAIEAIGDRSLKQLHNIKRNLGNPGSFCMFSNSNGGQSCASSNESVSPVQGDEYQTKQEEEQDSLRSVIPGSKF